MLEVHPFGNFVPKKIKYLMLGSFVTKPSNPYEWFYANGRNQFWPILETVYTSKFDTKEKQQKLFTDLRMALADIILSCERKKNSNLDVNLFNITFNTEAITDIIRQTRPEIVFFTSRHVENLFRKLFKTVIVDYPETELICLPSPSPRYAQMTKLQKIAKYKELLPRLNQSA
jgi:hypoxanthine-DNA glycosylase